MKEKWGRKAGPSCVKCCLCHLNLCLALESVSFGENYVFKFGQNLAAWVSAVLVFSVLRFILPVNVSVYCAFLWILWLLSLHPSSKQFYSVFLGYQKSMEKINLTPRCIDEIKWVNECKLQSTVSYIQSGLNKCLVPTFNWIQHFLLIEAYFKSWISFSILFMYPS